MIDRFRIIIFIVIISSSLLSKDLISPIPTTISYDKNKVSLGKKLFFDTRLSKDNSISCASCHILDDGGDDNLPFAFGIYGQQGTLNTPTVYNSVFNIAQFWDGRAKNLHEQAVGPIENPIEMGESLSSVVVKLQQDKKFEEEFKKVYVDGITPTNIIDAIAQFESTLITPHSSFDKYLKGDNNALTTNQKEGYKLFVEYGCISCHNGINIGGNLFQKIGIVREFQTTVKSLGKFDITRNKSDINYFKVPTLRNISKTAPYFHDGSVSDLKSAVKVMLKIQLGIETTDEEVDKIVEFLKSLDGEIPNTAQEDS